MTCGGKRRTGEGEVKDGSIPCREHSGGIGPADESTACRHSCGWRCRCSAGQVGTSGLWEQAWFGEGVHLFLDRLENLREWPGAHVSHGHIFKRVHPEIVPDQSWDPEDEDGTGLRRVEMNGSAYFDRLGIKPVTVEKLLASGGRFFSDEAWFARVGGERVAALSQDLDGCCAHALDRGEAVGDAIRVFLNSLGGTAG